MWRITFEIGAGHITEVVPAQELSWIQRCRVNKALDPVYNGADKFFNGQKFARIRLLLTRYLRNRVSLVLTAICNRNAQLFRENGLHREKTSPFKIFPVPF